MVETMSADELHTKLHGPDKGELALLDVREVGQIAAGHILFSAPLSYSRFELDLPDLVPNRGVQIVLVDAGDGVAARAVQQAASLGYHNVCVLDGGVQAWAAAGHGLFDGVNVPSKVFGEMIELAEHTPRISAADLAQRRDAGEKLVIVDGRPLAEYQRMNIPGAACCPNGELALRIDSLVPDDQTTVVVNCAGRTRSIIGAQTLIDIGLPNPVMALENGTQGWQLAGLELGRGTKGQLAPPGPGAQARTARARQLAAKWGVTSLDRAGLKEWLTDRDRTLYLFDVRTTEERAADPAVIADTLAQHRVVHAPGGQLVQATDRWVGVRGSRIVILDSEGLRAPVVAAWLARLGHQTAVVDGGVAALDGLPRRPVPVARKSPALARLGVAVVANHLQRRSAAVLDLRSSAAFCEGHVPGATWATRPRIRLAPDTSPCFLIADEPEIAELAAVDLREAGVHEVAYVEGGMDGWRSAGLPVVRETDGPPDEARIDFIFHTHDRHHGNLDAARAYLSWEVGLIDRLSPEERAVFQV